VASRRSPTGESSREDGFTLIEVLVALAILSVSLATLLGIFTEGLERTRQNQEEMAARILAQSLIAQTDAVTRPQLGTRTGRTDGGMQWRVDLRSYGQTQSGPTSGVPMASVTASVFWRGSGGVRSLTFSTLRAVPGDATP
jgi:general secretion pathway protein I